MLFHIRFVVAQSMKTVEIVSSGKGNVSGGVNEEPVVRGYYSAPCSSSNLLAHASRAVVKRNNEMQPWELIFVEDSML